MPAFFAADVAPHCETSDEPLPGSVMGGSAYVAVFALGAHHWVKLTRLREKAIALKF